MEIPNPWKFLLVLLILYTSGNFVIAETIPFSCPQGWENVSVSCMLFVDKKRLWSSAETTCKSYGANLVRISDFQSNLEVGDFAQKNGEEEIWIGLNRREDKSVDFVAKWADGSDGSVYEGWWLNNEPNVVTGDCVLLKKDGSDYKWWFESCEKKASFICEMPVCAEGMFHCKNGKCCNKDLMCDGVNDCSDGSDEMDCPAACRHFIKVQEGQTVTIQSDGYPSDYGANKDCQWSIESPIGSNVYLNFSSFDTEKDADILYIYVGREEIEKYSGDMGSSLPKAVASGNFLRMTFTSDASVQKKGFQAQVTALNANLPDREMITAKAAKQILMSPFQDHDIYPNSQNYVWLIQAEHRTQIITLEKLEVDLMKDAEIIIRDGDMVSHPLLEKITSENPGQTVIQSTSHKMYILFNTYGDKSGKGFKFSYNEGCSVSSNEETGMIYSSGYPASNYANFQTCSWKIETPTPKNIRLLFKDNFELADDTLLVYEGTSDADQLLLNVSNTNVKPAPLDSPTGKFYAKFASNAIINGAGFSASYSVDCPDPNFNENYTMVGKTPVADGYRYGVVVLISCNIGNYFAYEEFDGIDSVAMECLSGGKWNISRIPHCSLRYCGEAPVVNNGFVVSSTGVTFGSKIEYSCNNGFKLTLDGPLNCREDGTWETAPQCIASTCDPPVAIDNGNHNITIGGGSTFGSIVKYDCDPGYEIDGAPIKVCLSSGNWSESTPTCRKLECPLPDIKNGFFADSTFPKFQETRSVTCKDGYKLNGSATINCGADQTFNSVPTCDNYLPEDCFPRNHVEGDNDSSPQCYHNVTLKPDIDECTDNTDGCTGNCVDTDGSFFCTCNSGFFLGVDNKSCEEVLDCVHLNGYCSQKCVENPTTGGYHCECDEDGWVLFTADGTEAHMLPTSQTGLSHVDLFYLNHTCVRRNCPDLPDIPNGIKRTRQQKFYFEDKATYMCDIGYVIEGGSLYQKSVELTCKNDGQWSSPVPQCAVAKCASDYSFTPTPTSPITPVLSSTGSLNYSDVLTITCDLKIPGITPFTKQRKCVYDLNTGDYKLDGDNYDCGYKVCGEPPMHGNIDTWSSLGLHYVYGDTFIFQCDNLFSEEGTSKLGNKTVRCESDGQWGFNDLQCVGITCMDPGTPADATQVGGSYEVGSSISYSCDRNGFVPKPDLPLFCVINATKNGLTWNSTVPDCVDNEPPAITGCTDKVNVKKYEVMKDVLVKLNLKMSDNSVDGLQMNVVGDSVGVLKVTFAPLGADRDLQITENVNVTINVEDSVGNEAQPCMIQLVVLDEIPPVVTCPKSSTVYLEEKDSTENRTFDLSTLKAIDNIGISQKLFNPQSITVNSSNINSAPVTVTGRAYDTSNNQASCTFEVSVEAASCSLLSKPVIPFSNVSCSGSATTGYRCDYTCKTGYTLYEDPGNSISVTCTPESSWSVSKYFACVEVAEDVTNGKDAIAEFKYRVTAIYNTTSGQNISSSCVANYKDAILNQYLITRKFPTTCDVPGVNKSLVVNVDVELNQVIVQYTFTIGPQDVEINLQNLCYEDIKDTVFDPKFNELVTMAPTGCPEVVKPEKVYPKNSAKYECMPDRKLAFEKKCLPCPVGSEWNGAECSACKIGFFKMTEGSAPCTECAGDTLTYREGTTDNSECKATCIPGRISPTRLPPCTACPLNEYSVNQTHCEACPAGSITETTGATSLSFCKAPCQPGFYSGTGYEPCTKCPRNFYSTIRVSKSCTKCSQNMYTVSEASNSTGDCISTAGLCASDTCKNNGTCASLNNGYTCTCKKGYTGKDCEIQIDYCKAKPCSNGGTCQLVPGGYDCNCVTGTSGDQCKNNTNDCSATSCTENGMCKDLINSVECLCKGSYSGSRCGTINLPCAVQTCSNHGNCDNVGTIRYSCNCDSGYSGTDCENMIDECEKNTCYYNGTCTPSWKDFTCKCHDGYDGKRCGNRLDFCTGNTCGTNGFCVDEYEKNDYSCVCNPGYETDNSGKVCSPIDYCSPSPCNNGGSCTNIPESYKCDCVPGFTGQHCEFDIDDCAGNPCGEEKGSCYDGITSYNCICNAGYESQSQSTGPTCVAINECLGETCNGRGSCADADNDFVCSCNTGYTGKNCSIDIDDCYGNPCFHDGECIDGVDTYTCNCKPGWTGTRCEKIVEHCNSTICKQSSDCHDVFNGYFCECNPYTYGEMCENSARVCTNVNPCLNSGFCNENDGRVNCTCSDTYYGSGCHIERDFCSQKDYCKNGGDCTTTDSGPDCKCKPGFSGKQCQNKDDNCDPSCPPASCVNVDDKAYCACPPDKEGAFCSKDLNTAYSLEFNDKRARASIPYPVDSTGDGLSFSMNVRYRTPKESGIYFRVYSVPLEDSLDDMGIAFTMHEKGITVFTDKVDNFGYPQQVNDGKWHSVVAVWERNTQKLSLIVDTIKQDHVMPTNAVLNHIILNLGSSEDKEDGFIGELSQVNMYRRILSFNTEITPIFQEPQVVQPSIARGWNGYYLFGNVQRVPYAINFAACPLGMSGVDCDTSDRESAFDVACDMMDIRKFSAERVLNVEWNETKKAGVVEVKTTNSPKESLLWGQYQVTYQFEDKHKNKALCHFKIYVMNDQCGEPQDPADGDQRCDVHGSYKNCEIFCQNPTLYKVSSVTPKFYTCGPSGNWNPRWNSKFLPRPIKLYPSCGKKQNFVKMKLKIKFTYRITTPNCDDAGEKTKTAIMATIKALQSLYSGLCSVGVCTDVTVVFKCPGRKRRAAVPTETSLGLDITIPSADPLLTNGAEIISASDLMTRSILASDLFQYDFAPGQTLDEDSFIIEFESSCPFGQTVVGDDCVTCPAGTFYNSTTALCDNCEIGWYSEQENQTECTQCGSGETTVYEGSASKTDCKTSCSSGEKYDLGAMKCEKCPHGFYQPYEGQFFCYPCPAGTTTRDLASTNMTLCYSTCDAGYELNSTGVCVKCMIGYYRKLNSPPLCSKCPAPLVLTKEEGSDHEDDCNLISCNVGWKRFNDSLCVECEIGQYQNETNQNFCHQCASDHRTEMKGSDSETDCKFYCPDGEKILDRVAKTCEPCPFGKYRNNSESNYKSDECTFCSDNLRTNRSGSTSKEECTIFKCVAGSKPNSTNDGCESCSYGEYQPLDYQTFCHLCPPNHSTRTTGSKNESACEPYCESGKEMVNGLCTPCKEGHYRNMTDGLYKMCKPCKINKTTPGTGSKTEEECSIYKCSPGYHRNADDSGCVACDYGFYAEEENAPNCTKCESGESTRAQASNSSSQCEAYCESGSEKQGDVCVGCARGSYRNKDVDGLYSMCIMCNSSFITEAENSTSSSDCNVENCTYGQYLNGKKCVDCGIGYYQDKLWQTNCTKCEGDKSTTGPRSEKESDCRLNCTLGQQDIDGQNCENCSIGTFKNVTGSEECQKCPKGWTTQIEGAVAESDCSIVVCEQGYFRNSSNLCEECDYGEYENTTGKVGGCEKCRSGLTTFIRGSKSAADCILDCDAGHEYIAAQNGCVACGIGYYRDKSIIGQFQCVMCDVEFITAGNASTLEGSCNIKNCTTPGQFYDETTKNCTDCDIGYYQDKKWQHSCKSCGSGKTTRTMKSDSIGDCILDCAAGTQYDDSSKSCKACTVGTYRNVTKGLLCTKCPSDLSTENEGAKSEDECTVSTCLEGKFFNKDKRLCEKCPHDTFQSKKFQSSCDPCPNGRYTDSDGQTSSASCKSYCDNKNKNNCSTNATCADSAEKHFTCQCVQDHQGDGVTCTHLCNAGFCQNNGICQVGPPVTCSCDKYHTGARCQTDVAAQEASDKLTETITIAVIAGVCGLLAIIGLILCIARCCMRKSSNKDPGFQESDYYPQDRGSIATKMSTRGYMRNDYDNFYPENMHTKEEFLNPAYMDDAVYTA